MPESVTPHRENFNQYKQNYKNTCQFIVVERWQYGDPDPYCAAPTRSGAAYCERHRALCAATPGKGEPSGPPETEDMPQRGMPALPPEILLLEPIEEDEDCLAGLDLPRCSRGDEA